MGGQISRLHLEVENVLPVILMAFDSGLVLWVSGDVKAMLESPELQYYVRKIRAYIIFSDRVCPGLSNLFFAAACIPDVLSSFLRVFIRHDFPSKLYGLWVS